MFNVVWFKRDLRLFDHEPLSRAISNNTPTLCLFVIEPMLLKANDYSDRHWQFMRDCIRSIRKKLDAANFKGFHVLQGEVISVFSDLRHTLGDFDLFSHQETGNHLTYCRDIEVKKWCKQNGIVWHESKQFGVDRGRKNRTNWQKEWKKHMAHPIENIQLNQLNAKVLPEKILKKYAPTIEIHSNLEIQKGGSEEAQLLLDSFLNSRYRNYTKHISKPSESRSSCSRLSPHLAWGSMSIRHIVQSIENSKNANSFPMQNFKSRLYWHCHFIQKLESDPTIEFQNQNRVYDSIRKELNPIYFQKYTSGETGIPIVDAAVRCLKSTGYLNFRLRAMLVSFWSHLLWQPWTAIAEFLARAFTDYEPGIHYAQIQMQSSTVGYHSIRIYNPIKLSKELDPEGNFIKKWVPELSELPVDLIFEPWNINPMEELFFSFHLNEHYFAPLIDIPSASKHASDVLYSLKNTKENQTLSAEIMDIHVNKKGQS